MAEKVTLLGSASRLKEFASNRMAQNLEIIDIGSKLFLVMELGSEVTVVAFYGDPQVTSFTHFAPHFFSSTGSG